MGRQSSYRAVATEFLRHVGRGHTPTREAKVNCSQLVEQGSKCIHRHSRCSASSRQLRYRSILNWKANIASFAASQTIDGCATLASR